MPMAPHGHATNGSMANGAHLTPPAGPSQLPAARSGIPTPAASPVAATPSRATQPRTRLPGPKSRPSLGLSTSSLNTDTPTRPPPSRATPSKATTPARSTLPRRSMPLKTPSTPPAAPRSRVVSASASPLTASFSPKDLALGLRKTKSTGRLRKSTSGPLRVAGASRALQQAAATPSPEPPLPPLRRPTYTDEPPKLLAPPPVQVDPPADAHDELYALRTRLSDIERQFQFLQAEHSRCKFQEPNNSGVPDGAEGSLVSLFSDKDGLIHVVRSMNKDQRRGLLALIAEACKPSDIDAQIEVLRDLKVLRTGVLGRLDDALCERVIRFLDRRDILNLRFVAKRFDIRATRPAVWKRLCRELEAAWDGTIDLSVYGLEDNGDWLGLYKQLWQREKHWRAGDAQTIAVLAGHKSYVTSLALHGETMISGSYDDTIRVWHLPSAAGRADAVPPPPKVIAAKSVSCIDYYAPEGVIVAGSHEVGRATLWRQVDGEWKVDRILSGHLHGIRGWMVSVGSDKAIVVWDWRTGNKIVRFGQQTNVNVGMRLLDGFIITATVDGVIRSFSIAKREMLGQFRLADLALRQPEYAEKLKDVGSGALTLLAWFEAEGRFMACATKDMVIRLAWDWADPEEEADAAAVGDHIAELSSPRLSEGGRSFADVQAGASSVPGVVLGTPARSRNVSGVFSRASPPRSPATPRLSATSPVARAAAPASSKLSRVNPSPRRQPSDEPGASIPPPAPPATASKYALARWPRVVEIIDITGTERGAFEAGRVRIVTSRRLSSRSGAERRVLVGTELDDSYDHPTMRLVPLGGVWETTGRAAGLAVATKNPMSLAVDHDRVVDGSIVVAGFVAKRKPSRKAPRPAPPLPTGPPLVSTTPLARDGSK